MLFSQLGSTQGVEKQTYKKKKTKKTYCPQKDHSGRSQVLTLAQTVQGVHLALSQKDLLET